MEENLNKRKKKKQSFKFDKENFIKEMKDFYKKELKSKHTWNFVIAVFLYIALVITFSFNIVDLQNILNSEVDVYEADVYGINIYEKDNLNENIENTTKVKATRFDAIKNQWGISTITIISGLTPFVNIPVIVTVIYPLVTAATIAVKNKILIFFISILVIAEIYLISLIVAVGMYWCKMSTKHFRYTQTSSLTFDDVRLQYNEALKKQEKVEEIKKKIEKRYEKIKALNEKTNYKAIIFFGIATTVILSILTLITGV